MSEFRNELGTVLEKYKSARLSFFKWRFGVVQVSLVLGVNAQKAIALGALPFIGVDVYKALIASAIATAVTPGSAYGNEVDSR